MITQKTNKIDYQNLVYQASKKQRQRQIKQIQKMIEKSKHQETQMLLNYDKEKQQKKKSYIRNFLKDTMDQQRQRKKLLELRERQYERAKLDEQDRILARVDEQRKKQLEDLKQRARKVDYGSHQQFQKNQRKTLIQRKSEEWQTYKDAMQRDQILRKMQEEQRIGRKVLQNYYSKQMKSQILQRQHDKRQQSLQQTQRDKSLMYEAEKFGFMVEEQKRHIQGEKKKMLYNYLKQQQEQKSWQRRNQNAMRENQLKLNLSTLIGNSPQQDKLSPAIPKQKQSSYSTLDVNGGRSNGYMPTPGDTFRLDHSRIKQLQTISKALKTPNNNGPNQKIQIDLKSHRYFATKGLSVLG